MTEAKQAAERLNKAASDALAMWMSPFGEQKDLILFERAATAAQLALIDVSKAQMRRWGFR